MEQNARNLTRMTSELMSINNLIKMKYLKLLLLFNILLINTLLLSQDSYEARKIIDFHAVNKSENMLKTNEAKFLDKFSLGIKGGVNFSLIVPYERFTVFSGQAPESYEKDYEAFSKNMGMQMGFILMYDITQIIKISLQPSMNDYVYKYNNTYEWAGKTTLKYESKFAHSLRFFELPLIVGIYTTYPTWQPYMQAGIYYGKIIDAHSKIKTIETSNNLGSSDKELEYETAAYTADLYAKNHYGALVGGGISYITGNIRIGLEANYRLLISNLNTTETQYMNNQIVSSNYDVPDKFKFSNLEISLNLIVALSSQKQDGRSSGAGSIFCPSY